MFFYFLIFNIYHIKKIKYLYNYIIYISYVISNYTYMLIFILRFFLCKLFKIY